MPPGGHIDDRLDAEVRAVLLPPADGEMPLARRVGTVVLVDPTRRSTGSRPATWVNQAFRLVGS